MIPAYGMVFVPQNPSTGNGRIPGCSFRMNYITELHYIRGYDIVDMNTLQIQVPEMKKIEGWTALPRVLGTWRQS